MSTRPEEGTEAELHWLRGYEAGVDTMRAEVPVNMLLDLYRRHRQAALRMDEAERQRLLDLIQEMEWAFPDAKQEVDRRYPVTQPSDHDKHGSEE
jgi:hypothetical protein